MEPLKHDYNKQLMITLNVIALSDFLNNHLSVVDLLLLLCVVLEDEGLLGLGDEGMLLHLVTHEDGPQNQPGNIFYPGQQFSFEIVG